MKRQCSEEEEERPVLWDMYNLPPELLCMVVRELDAVSCIAFYWVAHTTRRAYTAQPVIPDNLCDMAARQGYGALVKWGAAWGYCARRAINYAMRGGHMDLTKTLHAETKVPMIAVYSRCAARSGNLALLHWVVGKRDLSPTHWSEIAQAAAKYGHTHILAYYRERVDSCADAIYKRAARHNQVGVLVWLAREIPTYAPNERYLFSVAVDAGARAALEWMFQAWPGVIALSGWCCRAVSHKQFHLVQWLREQGSALCACVVNRAAHHNKPLLDWLLQQGAPCNAHTPYKLAKHGCDAQLKAFVEKGGATDERVTEWVARAGKLELLQWLRAHQCPWDSVVCTAAQDNGHDAIVEWAAANGCPTTQVPRAPKMAHMLHIAFAPMMPVMGAILAALFDGARPRDQ